MVKRMEHNERAAVYARVSTEEQRERQTIENQFDFARRLLQSGIEIVKFYADQGVSGTVPLQERAEGARLS